MSMGASQSRLSSFRKWLSSFATACGLTAVILLLLAFVHRKPAMPLAPLEGSGIRLETINAEKESTAAATPSTTPSLNSILPATPLTTLSPIAIETPPVDVSVDLSQMLEWRYSYADMGNSSSQAGAFGVSNFSDVDYTVENIVVPPKLFPDELIDAGITEGRVVVKLLIDEKGHAEVKQVLSSTHPTLVPIIVEAMNRSIYSIPLRDGRPTKTTINRVVIFAADPDHVTKRQSLKNL